MQPQLTIIALSLWLIVFLGVTCVVFALVSMWKENRFGWPLRGILVHRRDRRFLCHHRASRRICAEDKVVGERHAPSRSCDGGLNMRVTEVRIRRTKKASVKAHAIIYFDNCFLVGNSKSSKAPLDSLCHFLRKT